jgi:polysaccharide deacetylase family protein (PEP-CTERM system associated)
MLNALSFNLEDYADSPHARGHVPEALRRAAEPRLSGAVAEVLRRLERQRTHATFFVRGDQALQHPALVRGIAAAGHEVAAQLMTAARLADLSPEEFGRQLQQCKTLLEDVAGQRIVGFRAPDFSLTRETLWALDEVVRRGFEYDSSIFPVHHETFGIPDAPPHLHQAAALEGARIVEFPPLTVGPRRHRLPLGGSPYLRFVPAPWVAQFIRRRNRAAQPALLCFHTWEFDGAQPRLPLPPRPRALQYHNLSRTAHKLEYLLKRLAFAPLREVIAAHPPEKV